MTNTIELLPEDRTESRTNTPTAIPATTVAIASPTAFVGLSTALTSSYSCRSDFKTNRYTKTYRGTCACNR